MKVNFKIDYRASWGQTVCVCGSAPELGAWNEDKALRLNCLDYSTWSKQVELKSAPAQIEYYYIVKDGNAIVRKEWGKPQQLQLSAEKTFYFIDYWHGVPAQEFVYTSPFSESFFAHKPKPELTFFKKTIVLKVNCPCVKKNQEIILCGESATFGNWDPASALRLNPASAGVWQAAIDASLVKIPKQYKLAIYDKSKKMVVHWEYGENRILKPLSADMRGEAVKVRSIDYRYGWINWRTAGVAIPVFSLRSNDSFGVGEFSDLKKMVDWAVKTKQKVIQILPINDTTITHTWTDSYPYNAISIYALHPLYLGLKEFPLKDKSLLKKYLQEAETLNRLEALDYEKVLKLKQAYCKDLFAETAEKTFESKKYKAFFETNQDWLFPYACFSFLRDKHKTANYAKWGDLEKYDRKKLEQLVESDGEMKASVKFLYFVQYLLHIQLLGVKEYANSRQVILKGDIPIGISHDSVDAWVEPHLFNLDTQTGAPPDDFSVNGQNWGFPTYNWNEMAKDNYQWWTKRFRKMTDYFDAYRIDHILGFFRIWEIPQHSVQGLLGHFSPALPFTIDEIGRNGMWFDEYRMTMPYIHEHFLTRFFGEHVQEVIDTYLTSISWQRFELKEFCNTQVKIKALFEGKIDLKNSTIKNGLYGLCNEVLFVKDKREPEKYHPRITAQFTYSFRDLDEETKAAFNRLYDHFFFHRHNEFWREQALQKLPSLISSTNMLVCGEDLGMIPDCVPSVMNELQILSLEIQRMPKDSSRMFENLGTLPYRSVCTTSTHDMAPIRAWWNENRETTQHYYNQVLWKQGEAPQDCTTELCYLILNNHLKSPAMLTILPLQDWLSIDKKLRRENPDDERINIPAIPQHYWRYRMHLTLEDLIENDSLNDRICAIIENSDR